MSEYLITIIRIFDISPTGPRSTILTTVSEKAVEIKSPSTLLLLAESDEIALRQYTHDAVSYPPVDSSFKYPFLGWKLDDNVVRLLDENARGIAVDRSVLLRMKRLRRMEIPLY
ncbi:hypothetical protein BBP40_010355 [Aspergillus hancockii]|nr:hypothetical protein BBP40_010355 [Aspergillus hancockii]